MSGRSPLQELEIGDYMSKSITILLSTTPYSFENTNTAAKIAEAALAKGHEVTIFASGDGVHNFTKDQKAKGIPNASEVFAKLIEKGLSVELCGTCLAFRGIKEDMQLNGANPSTLKKLFQITNKSDVFINIGM